MSFDPKLLELAEEVLTMSREELEILNDYLVAHGKEPIQRFDDDPSWIELAN